MDLPLTREESIMLLKILLAAQLFCFSFAHKAAVATGVRFYFFGVVAGACSCTGTALSSHAVYHRSNSICDPAARR